MPFPLLRNASSVRRIAGRPVFFHSTSPAFAKWRPKFDVEKDERKDKPLPKNYARYVVRRKRADAKRALNDFLLDGSSKRSIQEEWKTWYPDSRRNAHSEAEDNSDDDHNQTQSGCTGKSKPGGASSKKTKPNGRRRKKKRSFVSNSDEMPSGTTFEVNFGNKCYTWTFRPQDSGGFWSSKQGSEWRDSSNWSEYVRGTKGKEQASNSKNSRRTWEAESDFEDDSDEFDSKYVGSHSHRVTLGLPPTGPLQIEDVKTAFHASAHKWHPDKHQGPSQAMAGEKFKSCLEAYKSLCIDLAHA